MFTGIIEEIGKVVEIVPEAENIRITIACPFASELKVDESVAHNGVCLTVVESNNETFSVIAIQETLDKSNLGNLKVGSIVNLERAMPANGRFDGHVVQGHVDQTATCTSVQSQDGSWLYTFNYEGSENVTVEKGSITVNGVSLTVVNSQDNQFSVAIIPHTYEHTTFGHLATGDKINLEFDIIGKYVSRLLKQNA